MDELVKRSFANGCTHFLEMSGGDINATEMVASLINQKSSLIEGIRYAQDVIEGSMTMLVMTPGRYLCGQRPIRPYSTDPRKERGCDLRFF